MFIAIYTHHFWADGSCSDEEIIEANTKDELYNEIAETAFRNRYSSKPPYDEYDRYEGTSDWRIYEFHENIEPHKMTEYQKLLTEREEKIAKYHLDLEEEQEAEKERRRKWKEENDRSEYERLKRKFEG